MDEFDGTIQLLPLRDNIVFIPFGACTKGRHFISLESWKFFGILDPWCLVERKLFFWKRYLEFFSLFRFYFLKGSVSIFILFKKAKLGLYRFYLERIRAKLPASSRNQLQLARAADLHILPRKSISSLLSRPHLPTRCFHISGYHWIVLIFPIMYPCSYHVKLCNAK